MKKSAKNKLQKFCITFGRQKKELEILIIELIEADDLSLKVKACWGIVQGTNILLNCVSFKKRKQACNTCRTFARVRKQLAELVILGSRN